MSHAHEFAPQSLWWCEGLPLGDECAARGWTLVRALQQQTNTPTLAQPWPCTVVVERGQQHTQAGAMCKRTEQLSGLHVQGD